MRVRGEHRVQLLMSRCLAWPAATRAAAARWFQCVGMQYPAGTANPPVMKMTTGAVCAAAAVFGMYRSTRCRACNRQGAPAITAVSRTADTVSASQRYSKQRMSFSLVSQTGLLAAAIHRRPQSASCNGSTSLLMKQANACPCWEQAAGHGCCRTPTFLP